MGRIFLVGWVLLAGALYLAGIELAYRRQATEEDLVVSAEALWRGLAGDSYADIRAWVSVGAGTWVWRDIVEPLLRLPAWALLGIPGGIIAWTFHPQAEDEHLAAAESARTADELAEAAKRDGYAADDDSLLMSEIAPVDDDRSAVGPEAHPESAVIYARLVQDARAGGRDVETTDGTADDGRPKRPGPWG